VLWQSCDGLNDFWGFVDGRAADLLERESDPRITVELLPDWERNWGLPDPCYTAPQTVAQRQTALIARMTLWGSQSRQWYIDFAAFLGYTITITEYRPWMVGLDRCGDARVYGDGTTMRDAGRTQRVAKLRAWTARESLLLDRPRFSQKLGMVSLRFRSMRCRSAFAHRCAAGFAVHPRALEARAYADRLRFRRGVGHDAV
jgi:hypothetical protein